MGVRQAVAAMAVMLAGACLAGEVAVTNVRASQHTGSKLVDIFYDVASSDSDRLTVSAAIMTNGVVVPDSCLIGDVGAGVRPGAGKRIVWNAGPDWNGPRSGSVRVSIVADDGRVLSTGDYLVIDLSGGASAGSYPVTYLGGVPVGGWTDTYKTAKLVLRKIPAGTFTMGSPTEERERDHDEAQHAVTLTKPFFIGVFEVTQRQWELVMGNRPSFFNNAEYYAARPVEQVSYYDIRENPDNSAISPHWPQSAQVHADSFIGRLRAKTGLTALDLPTESQWEYACRAGTETALNSGKNLTSTEQDANVAEVGRYWYNGGSGYSQGCAPTAGTAIAGSYLPNAWGLYDMHGNAWEWCLDWYGTYPGAAIDPMGPVAGSVRMLRGGSWIINARFCRSANRSYYYWPDYRHFLVGFRAAMTLP